MKTWQDLKDHFKDSYRITAALEDIEARGLVEPGVSAFSLACLMTKAFKWAEDDYVFWHTIFLGLRSKNI